MLNVLLLGGAGFIGSRVAAILARQNRGVVCLVRPTTNVDRLDGLPWTRVEGDVRDQHSVDRAMEGCDAVIHLASPSSWDGIDSSELHATNVTATEHVLALAERRKTRVVFVSSAGAVNGSDHPELFDESSTFTVCPRQLPYAAAKREAEVLCHRAAQRGVNVVVVNPCEVYGPGDTHLVNASTLIDFARSNPVLVCSGGTAVAHVDDVAAGIVAALERGRAGERYILAGDNLAVRQLAELTLSCTNRTARFVKVPNGLLRAIARIGPALGLRLPFNPKIVPYATRYWFLRSDKARAELGVTFRSARATLEPTIAWLQQEGHLS